MTDFRIKSTSFPPHRSAPRFSGQLKKPLTSSLTVGRKLVQRAPQAKWTQRLGGVYKKAATNMLYGVGNFAKGFSLWAGTALVLTGVYKAVKPFGLSLLYGDHMLPINMGDSPSKTGSLMEDKWRRAQLDAFVINNYLRKGNGQIEWPEVADIVDHIAATTKNNYDFKRDVWYLFGWRKGPNGKEYRSPYAPYVDKYNKFYPQHLLNSYLSGKVIKHEEQEHHYLGGVTGNNDVIPSNIWLNPFTAVFYEFRDFAKKGFFNFGDIKLFYRAMRDRDDFLKHGRFVVGNNIRKLLAESNPS